MLHLPAGGVVCASSGTAALIGAILATAGRATPERPLALLPAFTFVATAVAVEQCGYVAYLADIDDETWMLDPQRLAHHPELDRIGLVVPVAPFGRPIAQRPWQIFDRLTRIPVVIDGAASLEGLTDAPDRFLGTIPVALSFHATKSFATGEGGAVATSNIALAERVTRALNFGFFGSRECQSASFNGKMSEYHAAVGLAELDSWPSKIAALRAVADHYRHRLGESKLMERFYGSPDVAGCYALFLCSKQEVAHGREVLERQGIDYRLWYGEGLHRQPHLADLPRDPLRVTDELAPRLLGLPMALDLSEAAVGRVVDGLAGAVYTPASATP
jgi:dTDP-4-amino-4,6-dideoxygalactose transaminase